MKFSQVIGHKELLETLRRNIDTGRVSHAQLIVGECGWGTLQVALAYIQYLHCPHREGGEPCGKCPSCVQIEALAHPDMHFTFPIVNPTKNPTSDSFIGEWREFVRAHDAIFDEKDWYEAIEANNSQGIIPKKEADNIIRKLSFKAFEGEFKSVIIWLPERMNREAANTLLKILEEPWEKTLFMLITEHPEQLLDTIISRTQPINVGRIEPEELAAYAVERLGATPESAAAAARIADGSVIALRRVLSTEGAAQTDNFELFTRLMRLSFSNRHLELFDWAEQLASAGREAQKNFFEYALGLIRESYMLTAGMENISHLWGAEREFCLKFAPYVANHNVEALVAEMERALRDLAQNGNPRMVLSHFALATSKLIAMRG
ncbi:MAG: DNA polymerase III subunit delta [Tidjanibacter sp.]|nr:DNA polymerase III subunit delta [Tidjanibacter sp.]